MNYLQFAKKWLKKYGLFDKGSDYDGMLGEAVSELCKTFSEQGHSGFSAMRTLQIFQKLNEDYNNGDSELWKEYRKSDESRKEKI